MTTKEALWRVYIQMEHIFVRASEGAVIDRKSLPVFLRFMPDKAFGDLAKSLAEYIRRGVAQSLAKADPASVERFAAWLVMLIEPVRTSLSGNGAASEAATGTAIGSAVRDRGTERIGEKHTGDSPGAPV